MSDSLSPTYFAYILQSGLSGRFYCRSTDDLERRIRQHNDPVYNGSKTTKRFEGPWKLVWSESFATRGLAMKRERQIKNENDKSRSGVSAGS